MQKFLDKIFPILLLAPLFFPLLYSTELYFPYITHKVLFLRGFSLLLSAFLLWFVFSGKELYWQRLKKKPTWLPLGLLFVGYVTSFFNSGFFHGFWSSFERGDGLMTLTAVVIYFYGLVLYADKDFLKKFFKTTVISALLIALYAVFQWVQSTTGIDLPIIEDARGRVGGTFNNAAFLSGFFMLTLPITLYVARNIKSSYIVWSSFILQLLTVFLTATRGALIAFAAAIFAYALWIMVTGKKEAKRIAIGVLVFLFVISGIFIAFRTPLQNSNIEFVNRLASISITEGTTASRLFIWSELTPYVLENPLGYGSENIGVLFNEVYDPSKIIEPWFDRSHNMFLDYALQYGILGLLILLTMLGYIAYVSFKNAQSEQSFFAEMSLILIVLYAVHNFFVFDTSMSLWLFLMFFGAFLISFESDPEKTPSRSIPVLKYIAILPLLFIWPVVVLPYAANVNIVNAFDALQRGEIENVSENLLQGYELDTYADVEYGYTIYSWYLEEIVPVYNDKDLELSFNTAYEILKENHEKYPNDTRTAIYLAHILTLIPESVDEQNLQYDFETIIERVLELSPMRDEAWFLLINKNILDAERASGEEVALYRAKAKEIIETYQQIVPDDSKSYFVLANIHVLEGNLTEASLQAGRGSEVYKKTDIEAARHAFRYYIAQEDWQNALLYIEDIVEEGEGSIETIYDLAKLYYLNNEFAKSVETFRYVYGLDQNVALSDRNFTASIEPYLNQYE